MGTTTQSLTSHSLAKRGIYSVPDSVQQITCQAGTLWITQADDLRDIILEPGQSFVTAGHRQVVAYVLAPATFTLATRANASAVAQCTGRIDSRTRSPALALQHRQVP